MGIAYGVTTNFQATKGIVQDGLVFNFDPGVKELYSGSGSSATALTGESISVNNSPSFTRADHGGNFTFDGSDDYLSVADSSENFTFANGNFSVGGWATPQTNQANGFVLSKGFTSSGGGWILSLNSQAHLRRYSNSATSGYQDVAYVHGLSSDDWVYVLATCDASGAAGDMKMYLNGSLVATAQPTVTDGTTEIATSVSNTFSLEIGRFDTYGFFQLYANSEIGPAHIYNKVLTAAEVSRNFNVMRHRFGI